MYYHRFYVVDPFKPRNIEFDAWSTEDVKKLSVTQIHTHISFDGLGYPVTGGLYDLRLGPIKFNGDPCATCGNSLMKCSGHYGHIELPFNVFNPLFAAIVANVLKISCLYCHTILIPEVEKHVLCAQLKLIEHGYLVDVYKLDQYLEEFSYKLPHQVKEDMRSTCEEIFSKPRNNLCKNADDLWRNYVSRIFRKGASVKVCFGCKKKMPKVTYHGGRLLVTGMDGKKEKTFMMSTTAKEHMRNLWSTEKDMLQVLIKVLATSNEEHPTDICFMNAVLVTPSNSRPMQMVNQKPVEHPKNNMYKIILLDCLQINSILQVMNNGEKGGISKEVEDLVTNYKGKTINEKLYNAWDSLQTSVNALVDSSSLRTSRNKMTGINQIGLKQLIEKKQGILRKNMMGKRVDFFARSVITPDPLLNVDEIGVPEEFAKKLTFPTPVTSWNVTKLRSMVLNGPLTYPGANIVEADDGTVTWITGTNAEGRQSLAKTLLTPSVDCGGPKVVHRHLRDGDMLLINRQPSLHKPSIMAHKARVLKGEKTFRLHYANCKAYNADFDGDEMNAHFPQGELARAEAAEIVSVANQYLVPRDGTPLSGLIQDHVVAAIRLSIRGRFFNRVEYDYLVFQALGFLKEDIKVLPPTILKPERLWSGKQIISTIIINLTPQKGVLLNLNSTAKIGFNSWPTTRKTNTCEYMTLEQRKDMSESNVIIREGQLLCGILDKNHVGATHYGLVHCFYELYGGQYSADLLGAFSKLFTYYLQKDGFTLGVRDILLRRSADVERQTLAVKSRRAGVEAAKSALNMAADGESNDETLSQQLAAAYNKNPNFRASIDRQYKTALDKFNNDINKVCLPAGLLQSFPSNNLQLMVQSGAKGSTVNTMQISCLLGQIELEGKRPPLMISGRSLPSFRPYDISPVAGGFIVSRFMTGIQPQEFFFHCMAGREGLIDTAVKTSRSGYLQRCLVKHLEGLVVNYDLTVRDSDNSVIQFHYGEDGLDISKSQLLNAKQLPFITNNLGAFYDKTRIKQCKEGVKTKSIKRRKNAINEWKSSDEVNESKRLRDGGFLRFCEEVRTDIPKVRIGKGIPGRTKITSKLCNVWQTMLDDETKLKYKSMVPKCPDPVMSNFQPDVNFSSISENIEQIVDNYLQENEEQLPFKKSAFKDAIYLKSLTSLCQPGEAVGVLAAQSVGEPSTQMTLNTFHFAGRGEMNVTLGIPRLREILMVASKNIKTPSMEIPFKNDIPKLEKKAEKLRKSLTRIVLKDMLEKIIVKESISLDEGKIRLYELRLHYLPKKSYSGSTNVSPQRILKFVETKLLSRLDQMLKKNLKKSYTQQNLILGDGTSKRRGPRRNEEEGDEEPDEDVDTNPNEADNDSEESDINSDIEGDGDATEAKLRNRRADGQDYEEDDEDAEKEERSSDENDSDDENEILDVDLDETNPSVEALGGSQPSVNTESKYFGVKSLEHDPVNGSWTKIVLWSSLLYKRLDLSALLAKVAEGCVIHEVPGIKRAIIYKNNDGVLTLKTEGTYGIWELFKHEHLLDLNKLYSNDVQAVAETYGIEAANRVIVREVQDVFKVYGITVDPRHLLLVADYMTFDGTYQALNRTGMDNCPSPFQQMTFESTLKYLKNATVRRLKDNLQSPSSSLMVGQETKIGAGLIKLLCK